MGTKIRIRRDPITDIIYAGDGGVVGLARFTSGHVYFGHLSRPGATFHRVTNPQFEYADTPAAFRALAQSFFDKAHE